MAGATLLYFDFSTHLGRDAFTGKIDRADWFGVARLEDFRIGLEPSGCLNPRPETGATVWGTLWMLPAETLPWLDRHFEVESGRRARTTARVVSPAGPRIEAMLYLAKGAAATRADPAHLTHVQTAARAIRLPAAYLTALAALA